MKLYTAKVRLAANLENEVIKHRLTAAEMKVLEFIHAGKHAVLTDIQETGTVNRNDRRERTRLSQEYSRGDLSGDALVERIFGVVGVPLPQAYEAPLVVSHEVFDVDDATEEVFEDIVQTKKPETASVESLVG